MKYLGLLAGILCCASNAQASRVLLLPMLEINSVHGGSSSAGSVCVSADMLNANHYPTSPVRTMYHIYNFNFVNISAATQTVTLKVLAGSKFTTGNGGGLKDGAPTQTGPSRNITTTVPLTFSVPPGQPYTQVLQFFASGEKAAFYQAGDAGIDCNTASDQLCIAADSQVLVEIDVAEDRGAMTGSVAAVASRCLGNVDKYSTPSINLQLNGGRPF